MGTGAAGRLALDITGTLVGSRALIGATGDVAVAAGSFTLGGDARLTAGGTLTVAARGGDFALGGGTIDAATLALSVSKALSIGDGGLVQATGPLAIDSGELVTAGGRIAAGGALTVKAATLDNRGGLLVSGRDGATLTAGTLLNDRGTLGGDGAVTIGATTLSNGAGTLAAAGDLLLTAGELGNDAGGQIWADHDATVTVTRALASRGSIAAARDLLVNAGSVDGGSGAGAGTLAGGRLLSLASAGGTAGKLVAPNALTLGISGDLTNAAGDTIATPGALTLNIGGSFTNAGRIEGGTAVGIRTGAAISNADTGSIVAPEITLVAGTALGNAGLINGQAVSLTGGSIANSGAIFGDRVTLFGGAGGITNAGDTAVIATRSGLLQLSSPGDIVNRDGALLYSLGDLAITGANGSGRAASLGNLSARIQAQGDIAIAAVKILNDRAAFATEEALVSSRHVEDSDRQDREHRTLTEFDESVTDTQVTADSGAGQIVGTNIRIDADALTNHISTISASGNLGLGAASVTNTAFAGAYTTTQVGTIKEQKRNCFLFFCGDWDTRTTTPFNSVDAQPTFTIPSVLTAGGTLTIDAVSIANLTLNPGGVADIVGVKASAGAPGAGSTVAGAAIGAVTAGGSAPGSVTGSNIDPTFGFSLKPLGDRASGGVGTATLDLGGLFRFAPTTSQVLVEAAPGFGNYDSFLSSDYFLGKLGLDPARVQRRLGDGLYEQQLIANQLVQFAGVQRLAGYGSNDGQYRALLDAGATYVQTFNLALGVGLSPAQMATLTSDIVLLVETTVQTPTGPQTVLAPRVYLTKADSRDLTSGGAIIAGRDLQLRASDSLTNAGVLRATASSTLVGGDITNTGRLDLGSRGLVSATRDLTDRGGAITGGDLTLAAGRDLTLGTASETRTVATRYYAGKSDQVVTLSTTTTNHGTDIAATGNVDLLAGRTLSTTATTAAAAGNLSLYGGQGIAVGAATDTGTTLSIGRDGKTLYRQTQTERANVLSDLRAGGDVALATPGTLAVQGGTVAAGGALTAQAERIDVAGVIDETRLERSTSKTSGGFLSSTKRTTRYDGTDQAVVASTLSGGTVALASTGDTRIAGSDVVADNGIAIASGGAIDVTSLAASNREQQSTRVKKSGLSISGGGLFLGVAKNRNDVDTTSVTNSGSLIGSTAGGVTLDAGRALSVTGSEVVGTGLTRLTGESVAIRGVTDTVDTRTLSTSSSVGISVGVQNPVLSGLAGVRDSARILGNDNANARTTAVAGLAGGLAAYNAADALRVGGANIADTARNLTSVSVSVGVSSSKATSATRDETNVASRITGQDVAIAARGAGAASTIDVQGSEVTASRDLSLAAPGAITLRSATETDTLESRNRSSGVSLGVQIGAAGITPSASLSLGRGNASGVDVGHAESVLTAGDTVSIATPDALTLKGATVSGNRVLVDAGSLAIRSEQDSATYASGQRDIGLSVSAANGGSVGANFTNAKQSGDYASVREQSGIFAGQGGFNINVAGATTLTGGVIASEAAAERNRLATGTLTAADIANTERYKASSLSLGGGIGGIGKNNDGHAAAGTDRTPGSDLPGLRTGIGTISATPPVALGASGRQSGSTVSAVAPGTIAITSGDAASQGVAATISRDTAGANAGALTQEYTANKREEIALGFAAAQQLSNQTGTFFANRAQEEAALRRQAETGVGADGSPLSAEQRAQATADADRLKATFGAGSAARIIATAVNGAAGSTVTGSFNSLVQASAVNVLQSLAVSEVKTLADTLGARNADGSYRTNIDGSVVQTLGSEALRGALQALVGCAGASAGGSGSCGSAAVGASASVALNLLINGIDRDDPRDKALLYDADGRPINQSTLEQQEARSNLVQTVVAAIAAGAGLDVAAARISAQIETENNQLSVAGRVNRASLVRNPTPAQLQEIAKNWNSYFGAGDGALVLQAAGGDQALAKACLASSGAAGCGAVQQRLDGLRANFASDTIAGLAGTLDQQRALGQLSYDQLTELGRYKAAIAALSPAARDALMASLRGRDPGDASGDLLAFLVSPETAVNVAASLAQFEQSRVGQTVAALVAFDLAFKKGVILQGKDTLVGLATLIGKTARFGADTSSLGDAGDVLRALYRQQYGTDLPVWIAAGVPSGLRGQQTAAYLGDLRDAIATYAATRANDPAKFEADARYVVNKYRDEFGAAYAKAEAEKRLPEFYGEISGRVAFEIATIILPTKAAKLARAGEAVEGLVDTSRAVDEAVDAARAANTGGGLGGRGPYSPQQVQAELQAIYGAGEVRAMTLPPSTSRFPALAGTSKTLRDGSRIVFDSRGFPIFDDVARYETRITMTEGNRPIDLSAATRDLRSAIDEGRVSASQFDADQLAAIRGGNGTIPNLTWHHHQDTGRMQLVPRNIHSQVNHIGSVSLRKGK